MKGDENDTPVGLKTTSDKPTSRASGWQIAHGRERFAVVCSNSWCPGGKYSNASASLDLASRRIHLTRPVLI